MIALLRLLDPHYLIMTFGLIGLGIIIFAESGLLLGFFLPGDSLLFTAGILAAAGKLNLAAILVVASVAAIVGDQVGFWFGRRAGPSLFRREDSRWFKRKHLERANAFYKRRGAGTIVLARFVPIVRTFAPVIAGAAEMPYRTFVTFNILGGVLWGVGMPIAGYLLGKTVPNIDKYLLPVIAVIVLISIAPIAIQALRHRRARVK